MTEFQIPAKTVPAAGEYDVIVLGGGTAGAFAGIAAAKRGCRTLIVEQFGALGGSATIGLVLPLMSAHMPGYRAHCPLSAELVEKLRAMCGVEDDDYYFDTALLKAALEEMAVSSGCELLYYTTPVEVVKEGSRIAAVIVHNKNGFAAYQAKAFIDCTGDADAAAMAGVPYQSGDHNKVNQPVSLRFEMAGIDFDRFHKYMRSLGNNSYKYFAMNTAGMKEIIEKARDDGMLTPQDACYFQAFGIPGRPDGMNFNCPELTTRENVVDAAFMTQKQVEGKKGILRLRNFLRARIPGFEKAYITEIAPLVGFRESRRIEAEYMLGIKDLLGYKKFPDGIAASHYPVDVHGVDDVTLGLQYDADIPQEARYWEVPFRTMVAKGIDNLLVAGRCAGMDFRAQSAARIMPVCRSMGEAAGIAAAIAAKEALPAFKTLDGSRIREEIKLDEGLAEAGYHA